ncbi:endonuclease III [Candidatus Woesearchaeota archaeon]|nr:endonuclease III [Candidatus Woesearchaeota archaeon]
MPSVAEIKEVFSHLERGHSPTMLEELAHYTPFQMLIMTMLSSRTKDIITIPIVKDLFTKYKTPRNFLALSFNTLERKLYGIGFYKVKARKVKELSTVILEQYSGRVPDTFEKLISLPGVGRKTANCILAYTFHKPALAVDTHVHRISNRLGWTRTKTPEETEEKLRKMVPRDLWHEVNRLFVGHGQTICKPQKPHCTICPVLKYCTFGRSKVK